MGAFIFIQFFYFLFIYLFFFITTLIYILQAMAAIATLIASPTQCIVLRGILTCYLQHVFQPTVTAVV